MIGYYVCLPVFSGCLLYFLVELQLVQSQQVTILRCVFKTILNLCAYDGTIGNVTKDAYNYKLSKQQFKDLYKVEISNQEDGIYNLDMILGYILQSALPTENNGNWVKNIGGRDYVFVYLM